MAETSKEDRQLPASEQRLRKAREEGNVPRSRDVAHLLVMGAGMGALALMGPSLADGMRRLMASTFAFDGQVRLYFLDALQPTLAHFGDLGWRTLAILLSVCAAAIAASAIPGGFNLSVKALGVKISRISPASGLKRIFSLRNLVEFLKLSLLASLLGAKIGRAHV